MKLTRAWLAWLPNTDHVAPFSSAASIPAGARRLRLGRWGMPCFHSAPGDYADRVFADLQRIVHDGVPLPAIHAALLGVSDYAMHVLPHYPVTARAAERAAAARRAPLRRAAAATEPRPPAEFKVINAASLQGVPVPTLKCGWVKPGRHVEAAAQLLAVLS